MISLKVKTTSTNDISSTKTFSKIPPNVSDDSLKEFRNTLKALMSYVDIKTTKIVESDFDD